MEEQKKNSSEKVYKLKKLSSYEGLLDEFNNIIIEIMDENLKILEFRGNLKIIIDKIIQEVTDYESYFIKMLSCLQHPNVFVSHSMNTAVFTYILSAHLNIEQQMIPKLINAALFHDVGKLNFNEKIKESYIYRGEDQNEIVKFHPIWGERFLLNHLKTDPEIARLVLNHHEKNDGTGYPRGLKASALTKYDHILATANLIDNILQKINYSCVEVLSKYLDAIMLNYGDKFPPFIRDALHELFTLKNDERTDKRYKISATGTVDSDILDSALSCDILNISSRGLEIATKEVLNEGIEYTLNGKISPSLFLKDKLCKIVWKKSADGKYFYGVKFDTEIYNIISKLI